MFSVFTELIGLCLGIVGMLLTLVATILPHWRITAHIGSNIITAVGYLKGLWMACAYYSTGTFQCETYKSLLALPPDLQAARGMMVVSMVLSLAGCAIAITGMKCTVFMQGADAKSRLAGTGGFCFVAAGFFCIIPISWTTNEIIRMFYSPVIPSSFKYEIGAALYLGMASALLSIFGGAVLCFSCCRNEGESARYRGHRSQPFHPRPYHSNAYPSHPMTFQNPAALSAVNPASNNRHDGRSASSACGNSSSGYDLNGFV
ncbi:claudin-2 [Polypterus senegalus]